MICFPKALLRAAAPFLLAFALIGCDGTLERSQDTVASAQARTAQLNNDFYSRPPVRASGAQTSSANFVAPEVINLKSSDRLPASAETSTSVVLISRDPLRLADIAARLSDITKIQHSVELGPNGTEVQAGADGAAVASTSRAGSLAIRPSFCTVPRFAFAAPSSPTDFFGAQARQKCHATRPMLCTCLHCASAAPSSPALSSYAGAPSHDHSMTNMLEQATYSAI
jgi:hypothetical protein